MNLYTLESERLIITTVNSSYAQAITDFYIRNKEHLLEWEDIKEDYFYTKAYQKMLIKYEQHATKKGMSVSFWIKERASGELVGKISVFSIAGGNMSNCMIGYKLDKDHQSMGYMHEALSEVIRFLFEGLKLHRIDVCILPKNERSKSVVEKLGFIYEGVNRKFMRINGVWEDHLRYALINEKYDDTNR